MVKSLELEITGAVAQVKFGMTAVAKSTTILFQVSHLTLRLLFMNHIHILASESALMVVDTSLEAEEDQLSSVHSYAFLVNEANSRAQVRLDGTEHQV
jgi:hypothetical protein